MRVAEIDFETYSEAGYYFDPVKDKWRAPDGFPQGKAGLQSIGAPAYAEHPSTELLKLSYNLKDGKGPQLWSPGDPAPTDLFTYIAQEGLIEAWNSSFEFLIWHHVCVGRMGWPPLPLNQLRCAMAKGAAWGLPGALAKAAQVLDAPEKKDPRGDALIRKLCIPKQPTKKDRSLRRTPETHPQEFKQLGEYCIQDIKAEESISSMTPDLSAEELELWLLDQRINTRGVYIDPKGLSDCIEVVRQAREQYSAELIQITGIPDITINKLAQLRDWLLEWGFETPSLDKIHVAAALERTDLPPEVYRVLQIRVALGSAGVKKLAAIERTISSDDRLRALFQYCGARQTGRWAGRGAQPQNLTTGGPEVCRCGTCGRTRWVGLSICLRCLSTESKPAEWGVEAAEIALEAIASRNLRVVEALWGDATDAVAGCLRSLFSAAPGHELICSDYSAIEAVVLAELAGESWRQEVFRTHGKIYEMSAAKISGVPFEEFTQYKEETGSHHPLRKKIGKVAELASGYGGWINAWLQFGAGEFMNEAEIKNNVLLWRAASPMIVEFWGGQWRKHPDRWEWTQELHGLEGAAISAILSPGQCFGYRGIRYKVSGDVLYCCLLSGRTLQYHKPRLYPGETPFGKPIQCITFEGWNSDSTKGPVGWMRRETYGGKLCENVVQATARDILGHAMSNVEKAGYPIVLHVHDEIVSEVKAGAGSIEEFESIMGDLPEWCKDWPVKASGGWRGRRYRKD